MAEYQDISTTSSQSQAQAPGTLHTTIITQPQGKSGGSMLLIVVVILLLAVAGLWMMSGISDAEVSKDNAVAAAADKVGNAAGQVGDAAQDVARDVTQSAD